VGSHRFGPGIVVIDGRILSVFMIVRSENVNSNENERIESVVIENDSKLDRIESKAFERAYVV
jgi:hypothetical protein